VLAAATPGVVYAEDVVDAGFADVWAVISDLEHELPGLITDLRSFTITSAAGDRLEAHARGRLGQRARFDVVLRPGWCVMQSRFLTGGLAAAPDGRGTRVAFFGGLRLPGIGVARPLLAAASPMAQVPLRRLKTRLGRP
ncbi:MAG: hypothetical protein ABJB47_16400, partial [Actinomycetota bacterium]